MVFLCQVNCKKLHVSTVWGNGQYQPLCSYLQPSCQGSNQGATWGHDERVAFIAWWRGGMPNCDAVSVHVAALQSDFHLRVELKQF